MRYACTHGYTDPD